MNTNIIYLRKDDGNITLTTYIASDSRELNMPARPAVLIFPGGGYGFLSERESEPIARVFMAAGFNAFILRYSVRKDAKFPRPVIDASLAMKNIRINAEEYNINPDKVFVIGFSAGGHLAGSIGTLWHKDYVQREIDMPYGMNKPTGMILSYPVLTTNKFAHRGSIHAIIGDREATDEILDMYSIEKQVDENTCPAFLWHTANDDVVPVENSLQMASALSAHKIPFELHIYPKGPHGISLATKETSSRNPALEDSSVATWISHAIDWAGKF